MVSLTDTVVIVTGGSIGSGRDLSRALAGRGFAVVVVYLDDQHGAEAAVDEIVGRDGTATAIRADIRDELDVARLFSETTASFGGVDAIVHTQPAATQLVDQRAASQLRDGGVIVTVDPDRPDITYYVDLLDQWQRDAEGNAMERQRGGLTRQGSGQGATRASTGESTGARPPRTGHRHPCQRYHPGGQR